MEGDDPRMGLRDIARFCEGTNVSRCGDTHIAFDWLDYRDENGPILTELIKALGNGAK